MSCGLSRMKRDINIQDFSGGKTVVVLKTGELR